MLFILRHPGEGRDPELSFYQLLTQPWTPAFAGATNT